MSITDFGLSVFFTELAFAKALPYISKFTSKIGSKISSLISSTTSEGGVIIFTAKFGSETVEGTTNIVIQGDKLYLKKFSVAGSSGGKVGVSNLFDMARDLDKQYGVKEVIIEGTNRNTGKFVGKTPTPVTIEIQ